MRQHQSQRWPEAYWTGTHPNLKQSATAVIEAGWVVVQGQRIVRADALRMPGVHNQQNLLMAVAVAHLGGIDHAAIAQAVASFPGVAHRLEYVGTWHGIEFINDSKATNYDAAQTGLEAVASPAILIAGGAPKVGDDAAWIEIIQAKAAAVLLIGDAALVFAQRLQDCGYTHYEIAQTMERAVARAAELAQLQGVKTVLLSPACASFDQYSNFEQRGEHFRQLCQTML